MNTQRKKILVTAGATQVPIDTVRAITNIFSGQTGASIALYCANQGHEVTLITSGVCSVAPHESLRYLTYKTFDELLSLMKNEIMCGGYDSIIHSAAVSDYTVSRVCTFSEKGAMAPLDRSVKISSIHKTIYLELVQTRKIIDMIRKEWGFCGGLVKFKLQVAITDEALLEIARKSRASSDADLIVANCLEWYRQYAYMVGRDDVAVKVSRDELPMQLERMVTSL